MTDIQYPKHLDNSSGWTINPEFLCRVSDRAGAVYGYSTGMEETEATLLAVRDLLREETV